jgi:hypothetical protein
MSRIFISHSAANNAQALALAQWLTAEGWSDYFLDIDPAGDMTNGSAELLDSGATRLASTPDLTKLACDTQLHGARRITGEDTEAAPILAGRIGEDVCRPPSLVNRWVSFFRAL